MGQYGSCFIPPPDCTVSNWTDNCNFDALTRPCAIEHGDVAWMTMSTILVLAMMPALSLFQGGLLRSKNVLNAFMQVWMGVALLATVWVMWGFSLVFGDGSAIFFGNPATFALFNFRASVDGRGPPCSYLVNISSELFASFYMMFACVAPLLITGAYAERMYLSGALVFSFLWEHLVFYPIARGLWKPGWLSCGALSFLDLRDFAGGLAIHTTAGFSAIVVAHLLGPRARGPRRPDLSGELLRPQQQDTPIPHNIGLATVGTALLWMGWYGFNAGSAGQASHVASSAITSTTLGPCISSLVWTALNCFDLWAFVRTKTRRPMAAAPIEIEVASRPKLAFKCAPWLRGPSIVDVLNGVVMGLAAVTAGSGFMTIGGVVITAIVTPIICFVAKSLLEWATHIDDELDVFVVHGIAGFSGTVFVGLFASSCRHCTIWDGGLGHMGKQLLGSLIVAGWSMVGTWMIGSLLFKCRRWNRLFCPSYAAERQGLNRDRVDPYHDLYDEKNDMHVGNPLYYHHPAPAVKVSCHRASRASSQVALDDEGVYPRPPGIEASRASDQELVALLSK